ncbi:helix-turn-helix domain-containing protein [Gordonia sp. NPDC003376]
MDFTKDRDPAVTRLWEDLYADLDALTDTVVAAIRREAPSYQAFPFDRHRADSAQGIRMIVSGMRDRRSPTEEGARHAAELGRDRARFGISLLDAIEGYHVVYRELWNSVLTRAVRQGPDVTAALSTEVGLLWVWVHRASSSFAAAHAAQTAQARVSLQEMRTRLISLLLADDAGERTVNSVAEQLGLVVDGVYAVVCAASATTLDADAINERFSGDDAVVVHCALDAQERAIVIAQGIDAVELAGVVGEIVGGTVGVGSPGVGAGGAARGVRTALDALAAASTARPVVDFDTHWPAALLHVQRDRFAHVIAEGVGVARTNPHLAETVVAFADSRFSVSGAAGRLQVHANSAKYRLDRWARLTGWDVFTADGLSASLIAIDCAREVGGLPPDE